MIFKIFFFFLFSYLSPALATNMIVEEGYLVTDPQRKYFESIKDNKDLTLDHVTKNSYEVWGPKGTQSFLDSLQVGAIRIDNIADKFAGGYPSPEENETKLRLVTSKNTKISQLFSIGKSQQGRDIWCVRISLAVENTNLKLPEVKYIANMHGDEIVGRELMIRFVTDLIENYGKEDKVTELIQKTDIYIIPSMNPDGSVMQRRSNASGIDLNRNFPDFTTHDNQNTIEGRAPETQAVMQFQKQHDFKISANFHGGAEVVNYPWDTTPDPHPLEAWFKQLSLEYSKLVPYIFNSREFPQGIVNGYNWYEVDGGMQDWSYHWHGDKQVTIELSQMKWPPYRNNDYYYSQNRNALIRYLAEAYANN